VKRFRAMGCEVLVAGATSAELKRIAALFRARERRFSRFVRGSELERVNAGRGSVVVVSAEFAATLEHALDAARATDGLVDPTLGAAIVAAGYDTDFDELLPSPQPVDRADPGSWAAVRVEGRFVARPPGLLLDLNGVVKGLTVDDALDLIAGDGLVSAGGDLAARGGVDVDLPGGGAVRLVSGGLATSGSVKRRWLRAGAWQHHLLDPRTGRPADSRWSEVTVNAPTCVEADVAAKAAFLLGDDGPDWLDERRLAGRFVPGAGSSVCNEAWRTSLQEPACT
jgi:thiamine biosynthesis lipoprotein